MRFVELPKNKKKNTRKKKKKNFFQKIKDYFSNGEKETQNQEKETSNFSLIEVVIIIIISILFGVVVGYLITYSNSPFYHTKHTALSEITNTYQSIVDNYYGELDEEKLSNAAIKAMVNALEDPYSSYMDKDVTSEFNETVDGTFVGIGVTILFHDNYNEVIEIYEDSPAEKVGFKVGDIIIRVEGENVAGKSGADLSKLIRGEKDTKVNITIKRGEEEITLSVKRGVVQLPSVHKEVIEEEGVKIGYIKIDSFASNTYTQFKKALNQLEKEKIASLILDVRDNPGGHLLQTKQILSLFFPKKTVLYQVETKNVKQKAYSLSKESRSYPIVVLINSSSASASEILASCFQENYKKALIIGKQSYGKGTVQTSQNLKNGTSIKYTTQKWLTSKGIWFHQGGVVPDVEVDLAEEYYSNPVRENDTQLAEAIHKLKESNY